MLDIHITYFFNHCPCGIMSKRTLITTEKNVMGGGVRHCGFSPRHTIPKPAFQARGVGPSNTYAVFSITTGAEQ